MPETTSQLETCIKLASWCDVLCDTFPTADSGPAHVVVSDYNFDTCFVESCLTSTRAMPPSPERTETERLLLEILEVPEPERIWPDDEVEAPPEECTPEFLAAEDKRDIRFREERKEYLARHGRPFPTS